MIRVEVMMLKMMLKLKAEGRMRRRLEFCQHQNLRKRKQQPRAQFLPSRTQPNSYSLIEMNPQGHVDAIHIYTSEGITIAHHTGRKYFL